MVEKIKLYKCQLEDHDLSVGMPGYYSGIDIEGVKWDQWVAGTIDGDDQVYCHCQDNEEDPQYLKQDWVSEQDHPYNGTKINVYACDKHFEILDRKPVYYVTVYETDRAPGGPEEGGWWYDYGVPQMDGRNKAFDDLGEAQAYRTKLQADLDANDNQGRRPTSSMASDGEARAIIDADCLPEAYPRFKPHYE